MRFVCFVFLAAARVATFPDDDLTISPNPSSDLFAFDTSNGSTNILGENEDDDDLFFGSNNAADLFSSSSSNNLMDNPDPADLEEASCNSGVEQPLSKRSGEGICDLSSPRPISNFINNLREFFGAQEKEGALSTKKEQKCLPPYLIHLCCTTEGPLLLGSLLIHEYMWWCRTGMIVRI